MFCSNPSGQSIDQFAETGNFAAGSGLVNHTLGRCLVDKGNRASQSGLCGFLVATGNGLANLLDVGTHGGADMGVAGGASRILFVALDGRFVIGQGSVLRGAVCKVGFGVSIGGIYITGKAASQVKMFPIASDNLRMFS